MPLRRRNSDSDCPSLARPSRTRGSSRVWSETVAEKDLKRTSMPLNSSLLKSRAAASSIITRRPSEPTGPSTCQRMVGLAPSGRKEANRRLKRTKGVK